MECLAFAQTERIDEDEDYFLISFTDSTINRFFIPIQDTSIGDSIYIKVPTIILVDDKGKLGDIEVRGFYEVKVFDDGIYPTSEYIMAEDIDPYLYKTITTTIERFIRNHGVFIHPSKEDIRGTRNVFDLRIVRCPTKQG